MGVFRFFDEAAVHFSLCLGCPVYSEDGTIRGKITDIFVDYEDLYPLVIAIQYKRNNQSFYVHWSEVKTFSYKKVIVSNDAEEGHSRTFPKVTTQKTITSILANQFTEAIEYPPIGKVVLDRQIVDTSGKKVVRVNDIQMIKVGQHLRVTHAEIGIRSMIRRLGYERIVDSTVKFIRPNSNYLSKTQLINWKYVHAIPSRNIHKNVKLNLTNDDIKNIHPADLADILEDLDSYARDVLFQGLDAKTKAETLSEVEDELQASFIKDENPEEVAKIIEEMDADDAADILSDLSEDEASEIISNIKDSEQQEEVKELLEYEQNTAGGLMSNEFFEASPEDTKSDILTKIPDQFEEVETVNDIYIIDEKYSLLGQISLGELLSHKEDVILKDVMQKEDIIKLEPDSPWREIAEHMNKYNLFSIPIVKDKEILGVVSVDDILPYLLNEKS